MSYQFPGKSEANLVAPDNVDIRKLVQQYEKDEDFDPYHFKPAGPVSSAFIRDDIMSKFIMGPVGGGKTVSCVFARVLAAARMPPCKDGWIRDRFVVVRTSFRDAERTVLNSWKQWFSKDYPGSSWTGGNDRPATHTLRWRLPSGLKVEAETMFLGIGDASIEDILRGLEISGGWMNEADTLASNVLRYMEQRTGRYPKKEDLADPSAQRVRTILGDYNAPDMDNWTYEDLVENIAPHRRLYRQPSGLSPNAENLSRLEPDYYSKIAEAEPDWYVRRMVHNEYGYSREGLPVYRSFDQTRHVAAKKLDPVEGLPLLIGMDAALNPAAILGQPMPNGQIRILDELVPGQGYGAARFSEMLLDLLERRYPMCSDIRPWADPACQYGADREGGEQSWLETMQVALGMPILIPANGSNELGLRLGAVEGELTKFIDGQSPRLLVSPHCRILIRGFMSGYRFKKLSTGSEKFALQPDKNEYSHPHDGLQYLVLGYRGRPSVTGMGSRNHGQSRASQSTGKGGRTFDPHKYA
ncbi:hypothetical protein SAMN04515647_3814 [Cohaesibacter sp. ES.047]|uniref:hypothetical protein n=1 Tax=Cohaesibacter sp. ES.047 TaxID=1798205 RepID=UPI000BB84489|nr:hypothetical protein [Cohaesibacter sp. ES.047]SNY93515.1 hypothetical protein SAMN04515647_3814 [Cohaesibacter sp. ES.047]